MSSKEIQACTPSWRPLTVVMLAGELELLSAVVRDPLAGVGVEPDAQLRAGVDWRLGVVPVGVGVGPTVAPGVVLGVTLAVQSDPVVRLMDEIQLI